MEHDAKCENKKSIEALAVKYAKMAYGDDYWMSALRNLAMTTDNCACLARSWGFNLPLEVGFRIGEKKAQKFMDHWHRAREESLDDGAKRYGRMIADRVEGKNVISLEVARRSRDA